jgi:hypothetical protein
MSGERNYPYQLGLTEQVFFWLRTKRCEIIVLDISIFMFLARRWEDNPTGTKW